MAYRGAPNTELFQLFEAAVTAGAVPLHACIIGLRYGLHRYSVAAEQAKLGPYDENEVAAVHVWPDHVAGGVVDLAQAKVQAENTHVRYHAGTADGNLTVDSGNKVLSAVTWATNAASARDASLGNRDVAIGDRIKLTWVDGITKTHTSEIAGLVADTVAGSSTPVDDPFRVVGFLPAALTVGGSSLDTPPTQYTAAYDASDYNGLVDGFPRDVYHIQVLAVGTGGTGLLDGTKLKITSEGNDVASEVVLGTDVVWDGAKYPIPLGARGADLNLTDAGSGDVELFDTWRAQIDQTFAEVDVTDTAEWEAKGAATYSGTKNTQYIITVLQGGALDSTMPGAGDVLISYRTNNGADQSGTLTIPVADFASATEMDYPIGIRDVELTFFVSMQHNTGDQWTFDMAGVTEGPLHTLVMKDEAPVVATINLDIDLMVKQTVEFPSGYLTLTADQLTVAQNAQVLSDILGTSTLMSIFGGTLYADYREQLTADASTVKSINSVSSLDAQVGPAHSDNPLGLALKGALAASSSVLVYYVELLSDDATGYAEALTALTLNDVVHGIVPLTNSQTIKDLVVAHVDERSTATNKQWRFAWVTNDTAQITEVYETLSAGGDILATVSEYPLTQYRQLDAASALFITNGVQAGDTIRINYDVDSEGNELYDTHTVDRVESETQIILAADVGAPIVSPIKVEVWRPLTSDAYATELAAYPAKYNNHRVYSVWADNPVDPDTNEAWPLWYAAACSAGLRAGAPPHAPLSNIDVPGLALDPQVNLSRDQLNTISGGGNWAIHKNTVKANVFIRHQLSSITNPDNLTQREQSKISNADHVSRELIDAIDDLIGSGNISAEMISLIRVRLDSTIEGISNRTYAPKIGQQLQGTTGISIQVHPTLRDTLTIQVNPIWPTPLNYAPITLVIS